MSGWYKEVGGKCVPCAVGDPEMRMGPDAPVGNDDVGDANVSTVFLGLNHSHGGGPPVLYETMIFGGKHDERQYRYHTREEAATGHARVVDALRRGVDPEAS